jgi:hypothetical protein
MLRPVVNAIILACAVIVLAVVMLESISAHLVLNNDVRIVVDTWFQWNATGWSAFSKWTGLKVPSVVQRALLLLVLFAGLYVSAAGSEQRARPNDRRFVLNFVAAFSVVVSITFSDVLFAKTVTATRTLQSFAGLLTTAIAVACALPPQPHLRVMTGGLWLAVALWMACLVWSFQ